MTSPIEHLARKPLADWGWRERWGARGAALLIGFFSVEVLFVAAWATRGIHHPPSFLLHLWAVLMAGGTLVMVEWKRRRCSKAHAGGPTPK
jgi:hypothetical protein